MKFTRVIGKVDPKLVQQAEEKLSAIFIELGTRYDNDQVGSKLGGDPLIFSLMFPVDHICTMNMPTAATDGKRFYWNPKFVLKQDKIGLRILCMHEAFHAIYMHPQRRGTKLPKLWNIAVDYIVNGSAMEDLAARKKDAGKVFEQHLGKYMTLGQYAELIKNPFKMPTGFEHIKDEINDLSKPKVALPAPDDDRELTDEEKQELENREKKVSWYFADPNLSDDMKSPEKIYHYLYNLLPKCPKCGTVGMYKKPKDKSGKKDKNKGNKSKDKGNNQGDNPGDQNPGGQEPGDQDGDGQGDNDHQCDQNCNHPPGNQDGNGQGQGQQPGKGKGSCDHGGCDECGDGESFDILGLGGTVDDHMDTEENEEKLAKRIADAMESARKMAGFVPGALDGELGRLTAPKVTWQDVIRARLVKARTGNHRSDWTKFRTRPMFCGMLTPKRKSYQATFGCLMDTSGSMSEEDMAYGLSQLQSLDEKAEGTVVPCDCNIYWDGATKIKSAKAEELQKVKVFGRGGTYLCPFFDDYEKNIGKCDFLIVITDGFLSEREFVEMKNPGVDVFWLITSGADFKAPFGRVFNLKEM